MPDPPPNVELLEITSRSVQLAWKSPYSGNSALSRFLIQYRQLNCTYLPSLPLPPDSWQEVATSSGLELRYTLKGLMPNCNYELRMFTENHIGRSEHGSSLVPFRTSEEVPGGPPLDVQVETTSSTSLKIKWRPPLRQVHFGKIRGYYIGYKVAGSDEPYQYKNVDVVNDDGGLGPGSAMVNMDSFQTSYVTNLKRKTSYSIILQAYNNVGPGPRSDEVSSRSRIFPKSRELMPVLLSPLNPRSKYPPSTRNLPLLHCSR